MPELRRLTATFEDPGLEAAYRHDAFTRTILPVTRFSLVFTVLVFFGYGVHDAFVVPELRSYAWLLRFGIFGPVGVVLVALTYAPWYERFHQATMVALGLAVNVVTLLIGAADAPHAGYFIYTSYSALFVVLGPLVGKMSVVTHAVYSCMVVLLLVAIDRMLVHGSMVVLLSFCVTVVSMGVIGAAAAWQNEKHGREAFLQRRVIKEQLEALDVEKKKSDDLLLNILPAKVADRLKQDGESIADGFAQVTVLFSDIVGFTAMSDRLAPDEVVRRLNLIFSSFDKIADELGVEKIKTIGDAYMVAGGLPDRSEDHPLRIAEMALRMREALDRLKAEIGEEISIRVGIHTGPVVAGVIGKKKFIYDVWGDTVNTASRMESHALPGKIQVTEDTAKLLEKDFELTPRGTIDVKGKGPMTTYFLEARKRAKA